MTIGIFDVIDSILRKKAATVTLRRYTSGDNVKAVWEALAEVVAADLLNQNAVSVHQFGVFTLLADEDGCFKRPVLRMSEGFKTDYHVHEVQQTSSQIARSLQPVQPVNVINIAAKAGLSKEVTSEMLEDVWACIGEHISCGDEVQIAFKGLGQFICRNSKAWMQFSPSLTNRLLECSPDSPPVLALADSPPQLGRQRPQRKHHVAQASSGGSAALPGGVRPVPPAESKTSASPSDVLSGIIQKQEEAKAGRRSVARYSETPHHLDSPFGSSSTSMSPSTSSDSCTFAAALGMSPVLPAHGGDDAVTKPRPRRRVRGGQQQASSSSSDQNYHSSSPGGPSPLCSKTHGLVDSPAVGGGPVPRHTPSLGRRRGQQQPQHQQQHHQQPTSDLSESDGYIPTALMNSSRSPSSYSTVAGESVSPSKRGSSRLPVRSNAAQTPRVTPPSIMQPLNNNGSHTERYEGQSPPPVTGGRRSSRRGQAGSPPKHRPSPGPQYARPSPAPAAGHGRQFNSGPPGSGITPTLTGASSAARNSNNGRSPSSASGFSHYSPPPKEPLRDQVSDQYRVPSYLTTTRSDATHGDFDSAPETGGDHNDTLGQLPSPRYQDLVHFLVAIGMSKYIENFQKEEIELDVLRDMTDQDMKDVGVSTKGARMRIIKSISGARFELPAI